MTQRLAERITRDGILHVVDVLPVQLANLARKLGDRSRVKLSLADSTALEAPDASYDRALLFFLLHEQPESVRRGTLAEVLRVVRPGGRVVIVDYHRPDAWNPLRALLLPLLSRLEPYAPELWRDELTTWLPDDRRCSVRKQTYFGGLYQKVTLTVEAS